MIRFKKVKHSGAFQDYQILLDGRHIGNVRAGFQDGRGRATSWAARSDVDGTAIMVSEVPGRLRATLVLIGCMKVLGLTKPGAKICRSTRDVGAEE